MREDCFRTATGRREYRNTILAVREQRSETHWPPASAAHTHTLAHDRLPPSRGYVLPAVFVCLSVCLTSSNITCKVTATIRRSWSRRVEFSATRPAVNWLIPGHIQKSTENIPVWRWHVAAHLRLWRIWAIQVTLLLLLLANVNSCSCSLYVVVRPSVCLSVVCNVRAPYSGDWNFRQCFYIVRKIIYPSFLRRRMVGGGRPVLGEILGQATPVGAK